MITEKTSVVVEHSFDLEDLEAIATIINRFKEQQIDDQTIRMAEENSQFMSSLMQIANWTTTFVESLQ